LRRGGARQIWRRMKLILAIIRPFKLEQVKEALKAHGVSGMTVTEVKSYGRTKDHVEIYRGSEYTVDFTPKLKLEFVVPDAKKDAVVSAVQEAAQTGKSGDGRVIVQPVDEVMRIRTGERGESAL
jgi:nitrogen regulatory protein PII